MAIDWITLKISMDDLMYPMTRLDREGLLALSDRVMRFNPLTGETVYETAAWDSIRSDTHGLSYRVSGAEIQMQGSPSRCWRNGCNVFGSISMLQSARLMVSFFRRATGLWLPDPMHAPYWVSRVDVAVNYDCGTASNVRTALNYLRSCEGGRYRVDQRSGDSVYWSVRSRRRSGKAYAKGPHIRHQLKKSQTNALYSEHELDLLDRLVRLELKLASQFWSDFYKEGGNWRYLDWQWLEAAHDSFFGRMIGNDNIGVDMNQELIDKICDAAEGLGHKRGQGDRAHATYRMIQAMGWEHAREVIAKATWYRHLAILRAAGFGDLDIAKGTVSPLRRTIRLAPVHSWADLAAA